jgi:hypothetical protein
MKFGVSDQTICAIHDILHRYPEVDQAIFFMVLGQRGTTKEGRTSI